MPLQLRHHLGQPGEAFRLTRNTHGLE
jgi:hypothetical protein